MIRLKNTFNLEQLKTELAAAGIQVRALTAVRPEEGQYVLYEVTESGGFVDLPPEAEAIVAAHTPETETPASEILLTLLADVTDVDETKPILEAMIMMLGGQN